MTCGLPWLRAKHDFLAQGATNLNDMKLAPCQLLDRGAWQSKVQTPREPWPIGGIITEFSTSCADQAAIIGEGCSEMGHMIEAARECPMRGTCWGGRGGGKLCSRRGQHPPWMLAGEALFWGGW